MIWLWHQSIFSCEAYTLLWTCDPSSIEYGTCLSLCFFDLCLLQALSNHFAPVPAVQVIKNLKMIKSFLWCLDNLIQRFHCKSTSRPCFQNIVSQVILHIWCTPPSFLLFLFISPMQPVTTTFAASAVPFTPSPPNKSRTWPNRHSFYANQRRSTL